jgi:hypothetical protein
VPLGLPRQQKIRFQIQVALKGVNDRIFTLQGGIANFFFTGGNAKFAYFAGGKSLLTLKYNICLFFGVQYDVYYF